MFATPQKPVWSHKIIYIIWCSHSKDASKNSRRERSTLTCRNLVSFCDIYWRRTEHEHCIFPSLFQHERIFRAVTFFPLVNFSFPVGCQKVCCWGSGMSKIFMQESSLRLYGSRVMLFLLKFVFKKLKNAIKRKVVGTNLRLINLFKN